MRRDRLTFGMMFGIPIIQLILFGFAINTDPRELPTAVILQDNSPIVRTLLAGLENSGYYEITHRLESSDQVQAALARGDVTFVITIPAGFTDDLIAGRTPQLLIDADASDPAAASNAIGRAESILGRALQHELQGALGRLRPTEPAFELITHARYNPEGITSYNIVPGLLGVILTMTLVMITGMAMTREVERGTMENLLAMPAHPSEVMAGKVLPYVAVGLTQTTVVLLAAKAIFDVPFAGSLALLLGGVLLFILANLSLGFTFSTLAKSQLQAMQLTFFFFLPSLLLSGFMFPFRGMPDWAQMLGEVFPLTHFLRIVRGVMLKNATFEQLQPQFLSILLFLAVVAAIAMLRYRRTLD